MKNKIKTYLEHGKRNWEETLPIYTLFKLVLALIDSFGEKHVQLNSHVHSSIPDTNLANLYPSIYAIQKVRLNQKMAEKLHEPLMETRPVK